MANPTLVYLLTELSRAHDTLNDTSEDQWEKGVTPPAKVGSTTPAREYPPRPVEDIVMNEPRRELRQAVHELEVALAESADRISSARRRVERAHARWKGLTPSDDL
jgi:hypothetical protein